MLRVMQGGFSGGEEHWVEVAQVLLLIVQLRVVDLLLSEFMPYSIVGLVRVLPVDREFQSVVPFRVISALSPSGYCSWAVMDTHEGAERSHGAHRTNDRLVLSANVMLLHHFISVFAPEVA